MNDHPQNQSSPLELQMLTLSDPAAKGNMLRHIGAVRKLFTGQVGDRDDLGLMITTGFGVSDTAEEQYHRLVRADRTARLYLMFDVDDAQGPPFGYGLFHYEDGETTFYHYSRPWLPASGGRPLISASNGERNGFFAYLDRSVQRVEKPHPSQFVPGYDRAAAKIAKLLRKPAIQGYAPDPVFTLYRQ